MPRIRCVALWGLLLPLVIGCGDSSSSEVVLEVRVCSLMDARNLAVTFSDLETAQSGAVSYVPGGKAGSAAFTATLPASTDGHTVEVNVLATSDDGTVLASRGQLTVVGGKLNELSLKDCTPFAGPGSPPDAGPLPDAPGIDRALDAAPTPDVPTDHPVVGDIPILLDAPPPPPPPDFPTDLPAADVRPDVIFSGDFPSVLTVTCPVVDPEVLFVSAARPLAATVQTTAGATLTSAHWTGGGSILSFMPDAASTMVTPTGTGYVKLTFTAVQSDNQMASCSFEALVRTTFGLSILLDWDWVGDLDLHLLNPTGMSYNSATDCYFANCKPGGFMMVPDWGVPGAQNDPALELDVIDGVGPEYTRVDNPETTGAYRVATLVYNTMTPTVARTRIFCGTTLQGTFTHSFAAAGASGPVPLHKVADVSFTSPQTCTVAEVNQTIQLASPMATAPR